jgi:DNA polymerase/3'-5' exonuclease PolX
MNLSQAQKLAQRIAEELQPFCTRIEIAGSIRRRRPEVNDIDLVCLPSNPLALRERILRNAALVQDGQMNMIARLANGFQLDVFMARPESKELFETRPGNFGSLLLCRTGSRGHNVFLVEHAKSLGLVWNPYYGVYDSRSGQAICLASETEEEIFKALQLSFVEPERRER